MKMSVVEKIRNLLYAAGVPYEYKEHEEARTSEESAKARGEDISIGAKAMVLKCGDKLYMFILSASKKIDMKRVRELTGEKNVRFASPEEVVEKTGCLPGGVPPFPGVLGLEGWVDSSVFENEMMAFNAGERTKSIRMNSEDYRKAVRPKVEEFSN